mmetsp:Transcript_59365/g.139025  ORF Transcript_59365/g.139025 Transcript_59365/m.139025 type:complete len:116 (-) Transcript_59365:93-440(-)
MLRTRSDLQAPSPWEIVCPLLRMRRRVAQLRRSLGRTRPQTGMQIFDIPDFHTATCAAFFCRAGRISSPALSINIVSDQLGFKRMPRPQKFVPGSVTHEEWCRKDLRCQLCCRFP